MTKVPRKATPRSATTAQPVDPAVAVWELIPSVTSLRRIADVSRNDTTTAVDIPRELLNPLESLPRPLSLDEVKSTMRAIVPEPTTKLA